MSYQQEIQVTHEAGTQTACRHHWIIDTPTGPVSVGVCRLCGAVREFRNSLDQSGWEDNLTLQEVSTGGRYPIGNSETGRQEEE